MKLSIMSMHVQKRDVVRAVRCRQSDAFAGARTDLKELRSFSEA